MSDQPHPFARFVAILGRGKSLTRSLTIDEAEAAMAMILAGEARPEQLGAFLMLLRVKEETGAEIAGFARAARAAFGAPAPTPAVDLDWPTYAGKARRPPWHLLAAALLAQNGWRVGMHGLAVGPGARLYSGQALARLGVPLAETFEAAAHQLAACGLAFAPLDRFAPRLAELMGLRALLGLRSPVHTLVRTLNPFNAKVSLQGVFHPGYVAIHRDCALATPGARVAIFRGDGGENERRPGKPCEITLVQDAKVEEIRSPAMIDARVGADAAMDVGRLAALWRGEAHDGYGEAAVVGTAAIALLAMGTAATAEESEGRARALWHARDRARLI